MQRGYTSDYLHLKRSRQDWDAPFEPRRFAINSGPRCCSIRLKACVPLCGNTGRCFARTSGHRLIADPDEAEEVWIAADPEEHRQKAWEASALYVKQGRWRTG